MSELPTYVLDRTFNAPPALVWRTWTEPELVQRWYGPGVTSIVHKMDVREGGEWLHEMQWGGNSNYQRADYSEVTPHTRLVWLHANTDGDWMITANPMMPDWPRLLLTVVTMDAEGDKTRLRLTWTPHEATDKEIACFEAAMDGMGQGWGKGMDMLEEILKELQG
ncbi:SRPBCC domain-containing protein [Shimia sp.]|uniref:SRPBCC family protein n=1 Tax=Shimia sp. TaxID=1954381 RepID=UPI003297266E